ncbi:MAG: lysis protein, partial [Alphaproteobacteria bacterium]|nr:lysis protein [Alphaproteobacteria bacterium]
MDIERTVSNDTDAGQSLNYAATNDIKGMAVAQPGQNPASQHPNAQVVSALAGPVILPEGVNLDEIRVSGRDLVVTLPDGTKLVIVDGAVFVPELVVGGIEIPPANIAALLIGAEPQPAAGSPQSSGGNFAAAEGAIGDPFNLGDLLPPTELAFSTPEQREIFPVAVEEDSEPTIVIVTDDFPAGATDVTDSVDEAGLPARAGEPAGSNAAANSETTTGTIVYSATDLPAVLAINGVAVTAVGQTIVTTQGVLTITSIANGEVGYSYTLTDNVIGAGQPDVFAVTITDSDGDVATATLTVSVVDDVPVAVNDVDSVTEDGPLTADGNVLTGVGGSDANTT